MPLFGEELVTRTKFLIPASKRTHLGRERLHSRLAEIGELPLGVVVAGTGYGKSSLLAGYMQASGTPAMWYELTERDGDPQLFALHLAHLVHRHHPGAAGRALEWLSRPGGATKHGEIAVEALADALLDRLETDTWLVLDDFHLLAEADAARALVNRLVACRPPRLHVVLASRQRPDLPDMPRWRLKGDVVMIEQAELAFQPDEIGAFFQGVHGVTLEPAEVEALMAETEGWPMALSLVAGRLRENPAVGLPVHSGGTTHDLFDYLAREVLEKLTAEERLFLLATAPLSRLEPAACEALTRVEGAGERLRALNDRGLFLIPLGEGAYRHHHLFREFLLERLAESGGLAEAHRAAARVRLGQGDPEEAISHLLAAGDTGPAAELMAAIAPRLIDQGRYARLGSWLAALPPGLIDRAPALAVSQGDACRLSSRFEEAIAWYDRAASGYADAEGKSRALAGKARVYLDTVQPAQAARWLELALELTQDAARRAELLVLLAENKMNQGDPAGAARLLSQAASELPEAAENEGRRALRTGRLAEGRAILESAIAQSDPDSGTKAHREAHLVLSLIEALAGDVARARALAETGLTRARRQQAAWTEAVALIRLGHAELVAGQLAEAEGRYREASAIAGALGVPRLKAEPLMGLAIAAGRTGDLAGAEAFAQEAFAITQETGDAWLSAMLAVALGGRYADRGDPRAERWLLLAQNAYTQGEDTFGQALVALWSARLALALGDKRPAIARLRRLTEIARRHDYGFLLTRPTLLGFTTDDAARRFATEALAADVPRAMLAPYLDALGLVEEAPPLADDALRIKVLGGFRIWRGQTALSEKAWGREKARQLFHLLLAQRNQLVPKSRIADLLWPDLDAHAADGTFRVALNALNKALEPDRPAGTPARFIQRQGGAYGLFVGPEVFVDAHAFERALDAATAVEAAGEDATPLLQEALELYEGDFLAEFPQYEGWCERERERLRHRFEEAALRLTRQLSAKGDDAGAIPWAQRLLERDPCAEEAGRLLMTALYRQGDRALALRVYDKLVVALDDELDVDPMPETQALYERITNLEAIA